MKAVAVQKVLCSNELRNPNHQNTEKEVQDGNIGHRTASRGGDPESANGAQAVSRQSDLPRGGVREGYESHRLGPKAPNVAPAETRRVYRVGSPAGRIAVLAILLGFGVMGLVAGADGEATFHGGAWGILWFGGCLVGAWGILKSPYILYVGRDWAEFVSLVETRRVPANEIRGIIRKERVGVGYLTLRDQAGVLDHLVIQLSDGSVTLQPGSEEIFKALTRISPAAQVTTEEYDPD